MNGYLFIIIYNLNIEKILKITMGGEEELIKCLYLLMFLDGSM